MGFALKHVDLQDACTLYHRLPTSAMHVMHPYCGRRRDEQMHYWHVSTISSPAWVAHMKPWGDLGQAVQMSRGKLA